MMDTTLLRSSSSPLLLEAADLHRTRRLSPATRFGSTVCCSSSSSRSHACIPKLEPFSRTRLERVVKDPPLIEKSENELADYCSTLEGDESYSCWRAYFELKDLEKEIPKADLEKLILQAGGVKSLIGCLHGIADIRHKGKKERFGSTEPLKVKKSERIIPIPDGLPKSQTELEEEAKGILPDSPYTRLLRTKGKFPAWYSPAPDHETD